jgi:hypothetical protein
MEKHECRALHDHANACPDQSEAMHCSPAERGECDAHQDEADIEADVQPQHAIQSRGTSKIAVGKGWVSQQCYAQLDGTPRGGLYAEVLEEGGAMAADAQCRQEGGTDQKTRRAPESESEEMSSLRSQ